MEKLAVVLCNDMHMDLENANTLLTRVHHCKAYEVVCDYTVADVVIIITCAFGPGKMYSVRVVADVRKNSKPGTKVIVTGCLVKLNKDELEAIPGISVKSFDELLQSFGEIPSHSEPIIPQNKVIISHGCLHKCSYCVYPMLVCKYKSKPMEEVLEEVKSLYDTETTIYITGAHETSDYGIDLYGKRCFATLLQDIVKQFPNAKYVIGWFHPAGLTDELISVIKENQNIVEIMLHIQHVDEEILRKMNRPSFTEVDKKIRMLKSLRPDLIISTEVIVGFPGETEYKFQKLVQYLNIGYFNDIGVASYESVLGTKASEMEDQISDDVKAERLSYIRDTFFATCYPASEGASESIIGEYVKAYSMLSHLPKNILNSRQKYNCIAGVDTREKLEELSNVLNDVFECVRNARTKFDFEKNQKYVFEKYTLEARMFFYNVIEQGEFKQALKERARLLLLEE